MIVTAVKGNNRTNKNKETMTMNLTDKDGVRDDNNVLGYLFQCKIKGSSIISVLISTEAW
jgi:hypothetical protein